MSLKQVVEEQKSLIKVLQKENDRLRKENILLKETLREALKHWPIKIPDKIEIPQDIRREKPIPWVEKSKKYAGIRSQVLRIVVNLCKIRGEPVTYRDVVQEYKRLHLNIYIKMKNPGETIGRCLRTLREWGYLFTPPNHPGYFYPTDKIIKDKPKNLSKKSLDAFFKSL